MGECSVKDALHMLTGTLLGHETVTVPLCSTPGWAKKYVTDLETGLRNCVRKFRSFMQQNFYGTYPPLWYRVALGILIILNTHPFPHSR